MAVVPRLLNTVKKKKKRKEPGVMAPACDPSTQEGAGGPEVQNQSPQRDPVSQSKNNSQQGKKQKPNPDNQRPSLGIPAPKQYF